MAPPQWAYQVENYVSQPDEELVCSICRAVFCEPTLCPCDHVFCKVCITKWLQNNRSCPICRKRASVVSIKPAVPIVKNIIMKLKVYCRNKTLGCTSNLTVESSEAHVKECGYELVPCKNKPCTDKLFRKDVAEHEAKDCPHRTIRCKKCKCKVPKSSGTVEHDCIVALRDLVKERSEMVLAKSARIKQLKAEIKKLKAKMKETGRSRMSNFSLGDSLNSDTLSSISPDEITINIHEFSSSSSLSTYNSDSDMSSIFYAFTNETLRSDNEGSDSFSSVSMDNGENEDSHDVNEYRNAESQTVEPAAQSNEAQGATGIENIREIVYPHLFGDYDSQIQSKPKKSVKRRPTTQKPAKRRYPSQTLSSDDEDEQASSSRSQRDKWIPMMYETLIKTPKAGEVEAGPSSASIQAGPSSASIQAGPSSASIQAGPSSTSIQAGPSSTSIQAGPSSTSIQPREINYLISKKQSLALARPSSPSARPDLPDHSTSKKRSRPRQKRAKHSEKNLSDNTVSSRIACDNPIFERTLALLEQHNLESDPEWLPDHARQRESDTTESDSSYVVESSDSDLSDADSLDNKSVSLDASHHELPAISDFMNWMFESTSEEDPDWRPRDSDEDSL